MRKILDIGFDIDGVVCDMVPLWMAFVAANNPWLLIPDIDSFVDYDFEKLLFLDKGQVNGLLPQVFAQVNLIPPYKDSIAFLPWYSSCRDQNEMCPSLTFITARHESEAYFSTHQWLGKQYDSPYSLYFRKKSEKVKLIHELGLDAFVEDSFETAMQIAKSGKLCFLIERPWNRNKSKTHKNLVRIQSLYELMNHIIKE